MSVDADALHREIRVASRNGRNALMVAVLAAVAALLSAGVTAWTSVHVSSVQLDRQETLAREQAIRKDRVNAYADFAAAYLDYVTLLGGIRGALQEQPPDPKNLQAAVAAVRDQLRPYQRDLAAVTIVGSPMVSEISGLNEAHLALWTGPDSMGTALTYAANHDIATDATWPGVAAAGVASIDKFAADHSIDKFVDQARNDLGSGR
ncbi:hypothetical protein ACFXO7_35610 [Nocardia tengchongensis]|uniref:hypothetical protein n=1 Tax=Nocardia tengchongensis TaxID=2055889 RepID=UPI003686D1BD